MSDEPIRDSWEDIVEAEDLDQFSNGTNDEDGFDYFSNQHRSVTKQKMLYNPDSNTHTLVDATSQLKILQRPIVHEDDQNRTAYVPQVKILKRPGKAGTGKSSQSDANKQTPVRSLAEREVAYAEARKRIMGDTVKNKTSSSVANDNPKSSSETQKRSKNKSSTRNGQRAPIERTPKGPDGSKGFKR